MSNIFVNSFASLKDVKKEPFSNKLRNKVFSIMFKQSEKYNTNMFLSRLEYYNSRKKELKKAWVLKNDKWQKVFNQKVNLMYYHGKNENSYEICKNINLKVVNDPKFELICDDKIKCYNFFPEITPKSFLINNHYELAKALKLIETNGYETWVSYEHQQAYPDTIIKPVHDHLVLLSGQEIYKKGLGEENIDSQENLTPQDLIKMQEIFDKQYIEPDNFEGLNPEEVQYVLEFARKCDNQMEPKVREVVNNNSNGTIVFVCGKRHFFGDYQNNLYDRLKDFSPHRLRLSDIDSF